MGDPSYVMKHEVRIRNVEGLIEFFNQKVAPAYIPDDQKEAYLTHVEEWRIAFESENKGKWKNKQRVQILEVFDDQKIVGYYYTDWCYAMRDLAAHLDGYIDLECSAYGYVKIIFQNGDCLLSPGAVVFDDANKESLEALHKIVPLPSREKLLRGV